jgi:Holliday junction resolvase RusA-like endonuclease
MKNSHSIKIELADGLKPKERPRIGRGGFVYTPKKTQDQESVIAWHWSCISGYKFEKHVPICVEIIAPVAMRSPKHTAPVVRGYPDVDNLVKVVLDALSDTAFHDDAQVVEVTCKKYFGTELVINISEVGCG